MAVIVDVGIGDVGDWSVSRGRRNEQEQLLTGTYNRAGRESIPDQQLVEADVIQPSYPGQVFAALDCVVKITIVGGREFFDGCQRAWSRTRGHISII